MAYEIKDPICQFVYQWQTLITGICALIAAGITVFFTNKDAKLQVKAAQEQTRVAQEQIAGPSMGRHRRRADKPL